MKHETESVRLTPGQYTRSGAIVGRGDDGLAIRDGRETVSVLTGKTRRVVVYAEAERCVRVKDEDGFVTWEPVSGLVRLGAVLLALGSLAGCGARFTADVQAMGDAQADAGQAAADAGAEQASEASEATSGAVDPTSDPTSGPTSDPTSDPASSAVVPAVSAASTSPVASTAPGGTPEAGAEPEPEPEPEPRDPTIPLNADNPEGPTVAECDRPQFDDCCGEESGEWFACSAAGTCQCSTTLHKVYGQVCSAIRAGKWWCLGSEPEAGL